MNASRPLVSVVIETVTTREDEASGPLADALGVTLAAVARQTYPRELVETVVVLDDEIDAREGEELQRRHPEVKIARATHAHRSVAAALEAQPVSALVILDGAYAFQRPRAAGVERRIDIDQVDARVVEL